MTKGGANDGSGPTQPRMRPAKYCGRQDQGRGQRRIVADAARDEANVGSWLEQIDPTVMNEAYLR